MNDFDWFYNLMIQTFPLSEVRTYEKQKDLLQHPAYRLSIHRNHKTQLRDGALAYWDFGDFIYLEHLAVDERVRGQGIGSGILREFMASTSQPICLEIEEPVDELQHRRLAFYRRLGFFATPYIFEQPMLRPGAAGGMLQVLSFPRIFSFEEYQHNQTIIFKEVYGVEYSEAD